MTDPLSPQPAQLDWDAQGQPHSQQFADVYFSADDGLAESEYVFLRHNRLPERWQQPQQRSFNILETGFGTGLNFLLTWQQFQRSPAFGKQRLHFISIEKYPLSHADLSRALRLWPSLKTEAEQLCAAYPSALPGIHRLHFAGGAISLDLCFGDVLDTLPKLYAPADGLIDAWYLDGFAPAKNPAMWDAALFQQMARLSRAQASFSTFTAAGSVRRGLQAAGFQVEKAPGFGRKREMLCGHWPDDAKRPAAALPPWQAIAPAASQQRALIIGGGLAGCATAERLGSRGWDCTLLEATPALAQGGSGNRQGLLYPQLSANLQDRPSQFFLSATAYAWRQIQSLDVPQQQNGLIQLPERPSQASRLAKIAELGLPAAFVQYQDAASLSTKLGQPLQQAGLFWGQAGWVSPAALCQALAQRSGADIRCNSPVAALRYQAGAWQALDAQQRCIAAAPVLILANAHTAQRLLPAASLPLRILRGQVTHVAAKAAPLHVPLCFDGYIAPAWQGQHCLGATYQPDDENTQPRAADDADNLARLQAQLPQWSAELQTTSARAALRCSSQDHLPLVGGIANDADLQQAYAELHHGRPWSQYPEPPYLPGLYLNIAHGSRGLASIPLSAEYLAAQLNAEPLPLNNDIHQALNPLRFALRQMQKKPA